MSVPTTRSRHRRWWIIAAIAVAAALIAATVAIVANNGRTTQPTVTLVAAATPGPNPFTDSVVAGLAAAPTPAVPAPDVVAKSAALRKTLPTDKDTHLMVAAGTTPGLYGGSGHESVCDPGKLVTFLAAHPDKAAAWAAVQGITSAGIGAFVATLAPVLLNSDTLVTNHGFFDGKADPFPSVLQAGTAVLVDAGGTPRAKCNCGNPLSAPAPLNLATAIVSGEPWPGYAPAQVTIVQPGKATGALTVVDITTGRTYPVGPGTGVWVAAAVDLTAPTPWTTTISTSTDGKTWSTASTIPGESVYSIASGNGIWVAAASKPWDWGRVTPPTQLFESTDLRSWRLVASLDDHVSGLAFGGGHWIATGYPRSTGTGRLAWQSTDAQQWMPAATSLGEGGPAQAHLNDLTYGDGRWISIVVEPGAAAASYAAEQPAPLQWTASSAEGLHWPSFVPLPGMATAARLAFGGGKWLIVQNKFVQESSGVPASNVSTVAVGSDGSSWVASPATGIGSNQFSAVAYGNGGWLAAATPGPGNKSLVAFSSTTFFSSPDAAEWTPGARMAQFVQALAFGPVPGTSGPPATAAHATAASPAPVATSSGNGGHLADGNYGLALSAGTTCPASVLEGAVLVVGGDTATLQAGDVLVGGPINRQTGSAFKSSMVSAPNSGGPIIDLQGTVAVDGTLKGDGTWAYSTIVVPGKPACPFTFTAAQAGANIGTPGASETAGADAAAAAPRTCNPSTVLAVVNAGRTPEQYYTIGPTDIQCTETWIAAGINDPVNGDQVTAVLQRVDGVWKQVDRDSVCSSGAIPASLAPLACNSN